MSPGRSGCLGPKPNPNAQVEPEPLSPEQELERIKKNIIITCAWGTIFSFAALPIAILIDEYYHFDEPGNPVFGGSYENS